MGFLGVVLAPHVFRDLESLVGVLRQEYIEALSNLLGDVLGRFLQSTYTLSHAVKVALEYLEVVV
jgi:hypothetical protein